MTSEKEADKAHGTVVGRLRKIDEYRKRFKDVFGTDEITVDHVAKAVATFERMVLSGNSPYDRFKAGDKTALTPSQRSAAWMSSSPTTPAAMPATTARPSPPINSPTSASAWTSPIPIWGAISSPRRMKTKGRSRPPASATSPTPAPTCTTAASKTLEDVVEHYDKGGIKNQWLHQDIRPLKLSKQDKTDLVAFLTPSTAKAGNN